jgi:hypothetical protein
MLYNSKIQSLNYNPESNKVKPDTLEVPKTLVGRYFEEKLQVAFCRIKIIQVKSLGYEKHPSF